EQVEDMSAFFKEWINDNLRRVEKKQGEYFNALSLVCNSIDEYLLNKPTGSYIGQGINRAKEKKGKRLSRAENKKRKMKRKR
ncbi:MAG: hypothetical protein ABIB65_06605, partial [Candidatus Margulisiibacteriota bacterium]